MKVSIVVPVFNLEGYIVRTLDSIFAQTYWDIEVIAVDDGSADNTPAILDEYAAGESRLRVIHKQNEGVSKARLAGIEAASGEYIGFVDGDDIVDPDMYERLLGNALKYGADISHCGYRMIKPDGSVKFFYNTGALIIQNNEQGIFDLLDGSIIEPTLCNKLYARSLFKQAIENPGMDFSIKNNEDLLLNYFLFSNSSKSIFEDFCPYQYIKREGSASVAVVNEHILYDPVVAARIIYKKLLNDSALHDISAKLYAVKLIQCATFYGSKDREISKVRKESRKELLGLLRVLLFKTKTGMFLKIKVLAASFIPRIYYIVHNLYSHNR